MLPSGVLVASYKCRAAPAAGVKRKAARKKRPKVTVEDLQKDSGFKQLVEVFPTQFRAIFKGPGHEVRFESRTGKSVIAQIGSWERDAF